MSTDDGLFFIDANRYLHLYRTEKGKLILKALREQTDHIFVTQQVVDEVKRNTIKVTSDFLTNQFRELKLRPSDRRRHHRAIDPDSDESAAAGGDRATCRRRPRSPVARPRQNRRSSRSPCPERRLGQRRKQRRFLPS